MKRAGQFLVASGVFFFAASAFGQVSTTGTTSAPSVADQTPTENLTTAGARGPSTIVSAARARHLALRKNRLAYQHGQGTDTSGTGSDSSGSGSSSGTDDLTGALGDLINSGGLGSLAGLLGGNLDLGSLLGGTGTGGTGTSGNSNVPSNLTPEVLQMLESAGIDINDVFPSGTSKATSSDSKTAARSQNILQDRWPGKTEAVSQSTDATDEQSFAERWKQQMALTFFRNAFTGITAGLSSPQLIQNIEDFFRPILRPDSVDTSDE